MSIRIMTAIWDYGPTDIYERMLLLAIADHANDEGTHAFPSMASLAKKCSMCGRQVIYKLNQLESDGWLSVSHQYGGRTNCYQINVKKLCAPHALTNSTVSAPHALSYVHPVHLDSAPHALTIKEEESSYNHEENHQNPIVEGAVLCLTGERDGFQLPAFVPQKQWDEYMRVRKQKKYSLTDHVKRCLVGRLDELRKSGVDIGAALDEAAVSGWKSIYAPKGNGNGNGHGKKDLMQAIRDSQAEAEALRARWEE